MVIWEELAGHGSERGDRGEVPDRRITTRQYTS